MSEDNLLYKAKREDSIFQSFHFTKETFLKDERLLHYFYSKKMSVCWSDLWKV